LKRFRKKGKGKKFGFNKKVVEIETILAKP